MMNSFLVLLLLPALSNTFKFDDVDYYRLPRLFDLDDYNGCLSQPDGEFCVGTFELVADSDNHPLMEKLQELTAETSNFNHTRLHRGYCVSTRCPHSSDPLQSRFTSCVASSIQAEYGLQAKLMTLDYCKTGDKPRSRSIDLADLIVAGVVGLIFLLNLVGTVYDYYRSSEEKPNTVLLAWSMRQNWCRLMSSYDDGDPRLTALKPIQGMKALTLMLVMMAHTCFALYRGYIYNPIFVEKSADFPLTYFFFNGSVIVQTFVMISSFLLAYNLLLHIDKNPKRTLHLGLLPKCVVQRIVRIVPLYAFVISIACTWWSHSNYGTMWTPIVEAEVDQCRSKWWAQMLFINNLYRPDDKCLIQTWFLAVDMQLYLVAAVLTLTFGRWPRFAIKLFGVMFLASIAGLVYMCARWDIKDIMYLMKPESIRNQLSYEPSFNYFYTAPWGSLPSSILGLFLAFLHFELERQQFQANQHTWLKIFYRISVPGIFLWALAGFWLKNIESPEFVAVYSALIRPVFAIFVATVMIGSFHKIDDKWWKLLSWRGFQILGRMSLGVLLLHWFFNLSIVGGRLQPSQASVLSIGSDWLATMFLTYIAALPVTLLVEYPMQRSLQAIFT